MKEKPNKSVAFHTIGCKVNQYDTQAMLEQFVKKGYTVVDFNEKADVYVINTCTVTNLGDRKSRQMIRRAYRENPEAIIAVAGCYSQSAPDEIMSIPGVKLVIGNQNRHKIVEFIERIGETGISINGVENIMKVEKFEEMPIHSYEDKTRAILKIQEGCNQFCAYCIIPYARGPVRSRESGDILREVERLVAAGFKEVVLTGIHVASYGRDLKGTDLLSLIRQIHPIDGLQRIRLGSLEPNLLTQEFIAAASELSKLCRHYHLSLQSGSDGTLKRMNRRYTASQYEETVNRLRSFIPEVSITTDIMVGFPGETQREFEETLAFAGKIKFSKIHVFQYSPRKGTPASKFPDQVSAEIKDVRSKELISLGIDLERDYMESFIGKRAEVLFEEESQEKGVYEGHTDHYIKVLAAGNDDLQGKNHIVDLEKVEDGYMLGSLAKPIRIN